jgi:hypothetical protein
MSKNAPHSKKAPHRLTTKEILIMLYEGVPPGWIDAILAGKIPPDVPKRPDRVYPELKSWDDFLSPDDDDDDGDDWKKLFHRN